MMDKRRSQGDQQLEQARLHGLQAAGANRLGRAARRTDFNASSRIKRADQENRRLPVA